MNCDPKTISRFKESLSENTTNNKKRIEEKDKTNCFIDEYKSNLLRCIRLNPQATRTD